MRWAKTDGRINTSPDWADLVNENPLAACIYHMMWTACDEWGILPGDLRRFKAEVCPLVDVDGEQLRGILRYLHRKKHIVMYQRNGTAAIYLPRWHEYNSVRWQRLSKPRYPLPECWRIPEGLREYLRRHPDDGVAQVLRNALNHDDCRAGSVAKHETSTMRYQEIPRATKARLDTDTDTDVDYNTDSPPGYSPPQEGGQPQPPKPRRLKIDHDHGLENNVDLDPHIKQPLYDLFASQPDWRPGVYMRWRRAICHALDQGRLSLLDVVTAMCDPERCPDIGDMRKPDQWLARVIAEKRKANRPRIRSPVKPAQPGQRPSGKVVI